MVINKRITENVTLIHSILRTKNGESFMGRTVAFCQKGYVLVGGVHPVAVVYMSILFDEAVADILATQTAGSGDGHC
jgi:hypothetical protein